VALARGARLLNYKEEASDKFIHAEKLHLLMQDVLHTSGVKMNDLDALAVDGGPGSYTGLRIGFSSAKGMAYALNIPLISISSLEILYEQRHNHTETKWVVPMLDARRMEVFTAIYEDGVCVQRPMAMILDENSFQDELEEKVLFLGDSNEKAASVISSPRAVFPKNSYPSARHMILPALRRFENKEFEDVAYSEPFYLKDFLPGKPKGS
jgi:tRNA threonylcarbamoyladenosine biosynthesis protein TsaB